MKTFSFAFISSVAAAQTTIPSDWWNWYGGFTLDYGNSSANYVLVDNSNCPYMDWYITDKSCVETCFAGTFDDAYVEVMTVNYTINGVTLYDTAKVNRYVSGYDQFCFTAIVANSFLDNKSYVGTWASFYLFDENGNTVAYARADFRNP